ASGNLIAYFDTSRAPFFSGPFTLDVQHTPAGVQFSGAVIGTLPTTGAPPGQMAHWTLSLPQSSTGTNGVITSQFRLDLVGLTASGRTNSAFGTIAFVPLNRSPGMKSFWKIGSFVLAGFFTMPAFATVPNWAY